MNAKKNDNILKLSTEERYDYFVRKVADFEEVWGLKENDGWALLGDNNGRVLFPVWPEKEFAEICAIDTWSAYEPIAIDLDDFLEILSPRIKKDNLFYSVFLTPENKGVIISPEELCTDIEDECQQYE